MVPRIRYTSKPLTIRVYTRQDRWRQQQKKEFREEVDCGRSRRRLATDWRFAVLFATPSGVMPPRTREEAKWCYKPLTKRIGGVRHPRCTAFGPRAKNEMARAWWRSGSTAK